MRFVLISVASIAALTYIIFHELCSYDKHLKKNYINDLYAESLKTYYAWNMERQGIINIIILTLSFPVNQHNTFWDKGDDNGWICEHNYIIRHIDVFQILHNSKHHLTEDQRR